MAVNEDLLRSVVFLLDEEGGDPTGTGFLVLKLDTGVEHTYLMTAKHVVDNHPHTFMRFRTVLGNIHDVPLKSWDVHPLADVAAQEVDFRLVEPLPLYNAYSLDDAVDVYPIPGDGRLLGERVYFVGLLEQVRTAMGKSMIPLVRSGTVAALWQDGIRLTGNRTVTGHLIDGRSIGGLSGAPCFVQVVGFAASEANPGALTPVEATRLLGIVIAHYEDVKLESDKSSLQLNTGIAVVLPIEYVRELIDGKYLTKEREDWREQHMGEIMDAARFRDGFDAQVDENRTR